MSVTGAPLGQPEPLKKRKSGLMIGIIIGAAVVVIGVSVLAFFLFSDRQAPTLTNAQFDTMFAKGERFMDEKISEHRPGTKWAESGKDICETARNKLFNSADNSLVVNTTLGSVSAGRFAGPAQADNAYEAVSSECSSMSQQNGVIDGAKWFTFSRSLGEDGVFVLYGNVALVAYFDANAPDIVTAIRTEIRNAAER